MAAATTHSDRPKSGFVEMIILITITVLVVVVLIMIYSYEPYPAMFGVTDASLTEYNNSSSNLHYDLDLNVTVRNRNKKYGIFYDNLQVMAYYQKNHMYHMLGIENLTSFYQGKKNTTHLKLSLKLGQLRLHHVLSNDDGAISYHDIDVKLHVRNRYKAKYTRKGNSNITCHLEVPLISSRDNGSQSANTNTSTSNFNTTWCSYSTGQDFSGFPMAFFILLGIYCVFVLLILVVFFVGY